MASRPSGVLWRAVRTGPPRLRHPSPAPAPQRQLGTTPRAPRAFQGHTGGSISTGESRSGSGGCGGECLQHTSIRSCIRPQSAGQSDGLLLQDPRGAVQELISVPWASPWVPAAAGSQGTAASPCPTHGSTARAQRPGRVLGSSLTVLLLLQPRWDTGPARALRRRWRSTGLSPREAM